MLWNNDSEKGEHTKERRAKIQSSEILLFTFYPQRVEYQKKPEIMRLLHIQ